MPAFVSTPLSSSASAAPSRRGATCTRMSTEQTAPVSRRDILACGAAAVAAALALGAPALAERDYAGVPYLGGADQIDINNANVRVYQRFPGMYPTIAGLIAKNGPYGSVKDVYKISELTSAQKDIIKKYEDKMLALKPVFEYEIDKINNFIYK